MAKVPKQTIIKGNGETLFAVRDAQNERFVEYVFVLILWNTSKSTIAFKHR
jgi:hypothetical protein